MTDFPRWERESQEDLQPLVAGAQRPEETVEFDATTAFEDLDDADADAEPRRTPWPSRETLLIASDRIVRWFAGLDRRPEFEPDRGPDRGPDPIAELMPGSDGDPDATAPNPDVGAAAATPPPRGRDVPRAPAPDSASRFPTAPLGYNRQAVDLHLSELEQQLSALRDRMDPPISITEEIEKIGEQTASILVVAHDKAHETTRRAQEQAERCVRDATANAAAITAEAERRLRELDEETDAVWRDRERLLDDVRVVSHTLTTLADDASARFPADSKATEGSTLSR